MRRSEAEKQKRSYGNAGFKRLAFLLLCAFAGLILCAGCGRKRAEEPAAGEPGGQALIVLEPSAEVETEVIEEQPEEEVDNRTPEEKLLDEIIEGHVSWENAPRIGDRDALMDYMRLVRDARLPEAPVIFTGGYMGDYEEILSAVNFAYIDFEIRSAENDENHVLYMLTYYPGERVADAWLAGTTEGLTDEELILYDVASDIVEKAQELPSDLHRELFIHDQIIGRATYHNREERVGVPRFCTALGALLDGQANCQGYTDAFYMLATMAGLRVGKQSGITGQDDHVWNVISINGKWYAVDCTWDDASFSRDGTEYTSYMYFNAPAEIMDISHESKSYTVEFELTETLADAPDYFFMTDEATEQYFGFYFDSMDELAEDAAAKLDAGARFVYSMAKADPSRYSRYKDVTRAIDAKRSGKSKYYVILTNRGDYSFVTIDATGEKGAETEETQSGNAGIGDDVVYPDTSESIETGEAQPLAEAGDEPALIDENGSYTSAEDVALYIRTYGRLPGNFITKSEARKLGWTGGGLEDYAPGMSIGGDRFGNYERRLPDGKYTECDIDTMGRLSRGSKRLIFSDDGRIYYTEDHYETFTQLWPE